MTLSDDECISKIFNDTKHRVVSLRQLSLYYFTKSDRHRCLVPRAAEDLINEMLYKNHVTM